MIRMKAFSFKTAYSRKHSFRNLKLLDYKVKFNRNIVMRRYFYETNSIFIHIPKAAGKSIAQALYGDDRPGHFLWHNYEAADAVSFSQFFKFSFVRHPIDRLESAYYYLKNGGASQTDLQFSKRVLRSFESIDDFVMNWLSVDRNHYSWIHFIPQFEFISDSDGRIVIDYVGRFESLEYDFKNIAERLGSGRLLSHINPSQRFHKFSMSSESAAICRDLYKKDFELFNY